MDNNKDIAVKSKKIPIPHAFFGRNGGHSEAAYSSLNCSVYVGDSDKNVKANLEIVGGFLCVKTRVVTLKQIHSAICIEAFPNSDSGIEADALVTREKNVAIGILTADCAPILFFDPKKSIVGAAHAGWRGAVGGVIEATVMKMRELGGVPSDIIAAVGPCIGKENYVVNDDFRRNFFGNENCFSLINNRVHFDLSQFCRNKLIAAGLKESNVDVINIDTYAHCDDYFSYRFAVKNSSGICGRQISAICLS